MEKIDLLQVPNVPVAAQKGRKEILTDGATPIATLQMETGAQSAWNAELWVREL